MSALRHIEPALPEIAHAVAEGLLRQPKALPPRLFYDAEGSRLFEQITALPEYYPTRTEREILETYAHDILERAGANISLIELGAGTAAKTSTLIRALLRRQLQVKFYPIDVCESALEVARQNLCSISSRVKVFPVVADYTRGFDGVGLLEGRKLALYLGSSIGNFELPEAGGVLRQLRSNLCPGDALLLGADLAKDPAVLLPAYDDHAGVTARFNQNLLARINRELDADFDLRCFRHVALWNSSLSRIEMYLESTRAQEVRIGRLGISVPFAAGERIHTENSYKYTPAMVRGLFADGGFTLEHTWTDRREWFAVHLARAA